MAWCIHMLSSLQSSLQLAVTYHTSMSLITGRSLASSSMMLLSGCSMDNTSCLLWWPLAYCWYLLSYHQWFCCCTQPRLLDCAYNRKCVECSGRDAWNWAVYCIITLVPTTILFLVFMIFRVNLNAPPLSAFVSISQFFSVPILIEQVQFLTETYPHSTATLLIHNILTAFYGIWNLDYLRVLIPPFCLPGVRNSIYALAVEYLVAFYPLLLVVLAYVIISCMIVGRG